MRFSIIIPVYNAENTIERALASLISNKDYIKEVILVNDRSNDNTFSYVNNFKTFLDIKVIDNKGNQGPGPSRKTGLLEAKSEWITFLDADDCLTPNSLYYVSKEIEENEKIVLLHTQSIYYESGNFNPDSIGHSDTSCGGNFYKKEYLLTNNIFPHDDLYMSEDEYFNEILYNYLIYCEKNGEDMIQYYDYPVYEVHHDLSKELSFAHRNWGEYLCKYHLLYKNYVIEFFKDKDIIESLEEDFLNNFIFAYFLYQALLQDTDISFQKSEAKYFNTSLDFYKQTYCKSERDIINYFYRNNSLVKSIYESATLSAGFEFKRTFPFEKFLYKIIPTYK
jgi:glycosyltransferase involved in cell wall biosynthesis